MSPRISNRILIVSLALFVSSTLDATYLPIDQERLKNILITHLDSLTVSLDSSTFANPLQKFHPMLRRSIELTLLDEGYTLPPASAFFKGMDEATRDLRSGRLRLMYLGGDDIEIQVDSSWWNASNIYQYNLSRRFAVKLLAAPSDAHYVWHSLYVQGYNSVAEAVLNEYFECDIQKVAWEAVKNTIEIEGRLHQDWLIHRE